MNATIEQLNPPTDLLECLDYIAQLIDGGYQIFVYQRDPCLRACIVSPCGAWRVGYLTLGAPAASRGGPHIERHDPVKCDTWHRAGYPLTATDWNTLANEYREHRSDWRNGCFENSFSPWTR